MADAPHGGAAPPAAAPRAASPQPEDPPLPWPLSLLAAYVPPAARPLLSEARIGLRASWAATLLLPAALLPSLLALALPLPAALVAIALFVPWLAGAWQRRLSDLWTAARAAAGRQLAREAKWAGQGETAEWANAWVQLHWEKVEPWVSAQVTAVANALLDENRPAFLDALELSEFTLGGEAPRIESIATHAEPGGDFVQYRIRLGFHPPPTPGPRIVLTATVGRAGLRLPVPVLVSDLSFGIALTVRARLEAGAPPNVRTVNVAVAEGDAKGVEVGFVLRPLKSVDLLDLPGLRYFINSLVDTNVRTLLAPPGVTIDVGALLAPDTHVNRDLAVGLLRVRILRARNLAGEGWLGGRGDPYVRVLLGPAGSTRELARTRWIPRSGDPDWLELHHVLVPGAAFSSPAEDLGDLVHFEVRDHADFSGDRLVGVTQPLRLGKWASLLPKAPAADGKGKEGGDAEVQGIEGMEDPGEEERMRQAWGSPLGGDSVWKLLHRPNRRPADQCGLLQLQLAYFPIRDTTGERVEPAATKGSALEASAAAVPEEEGKVDPKGEMEAKEAVPGGLKEEDGDRGIKVVAVPAETMDAAAPDGLERGGDTTPAPSLKEELGIAKPPIHTGILRVTVHQARNLDTDGPDEQHRNRSAARFLFEAAQKAVGGVAGLILSGAFAPYVAVRTGDGKVAWKSVRRRRTVDPLFEQTFELFVEDIRRARLHFAVRNATDFASDPVVGECTVRIAEALQRNPLDDWYTLYNCDTGELRLTFVFLPIDLRRLMHQVHKVRRNVRLGRPANADTDSVSVSSDNSESEASSEPPQPDMPRAEPGEPRLFPAGIRAGAGNPRLYITLHSVRNLPSSVDAYVLASIAAGANDPEPVPVFRTKAAIQDPDPEFDDRFDLDIDDWMPRDARMVFEVRDRRDGVDPTDDPVVGRAHVGLAQLRPNVMKEAWLPIRTVEGGWELDRDAGVRVALLLRPDDSLGDFRVEEDRGRVAIPPELAERPRPSMEEKRLEKLEGGGNGIRAGVKDLGQKVGRTFKSLARTPVNLVTSPKRAHDAPAEPNPDFSDPTAEPGSLLHYAPPTKLHRAKTAVGKSGIGAEIMYWINFLGRGVVRPKHMVGGVLRMRLVSVTSPDGKFDQTIRIVRPQHTFTKSAIPVNNMLAPNGAVELPLGPSEAAKFSIQLFGHGGVLSLGGKTLNVDLDMREILRTRGNGWTEGDEGSVWHDVVAIAVNPEDGTAGAAETVVAPNRVDVTLDVEFRAVADEGRLKRIFQITETRTRDPLIAISSTAAQSVAPSAPRAGNVAADSPLAMLTTVQPAPTVPADVTLQNALEHQELENERYPPEI
ncbi:hypothetical protein DFJ74DRAFT_707400 [Hyaloraphidium curvatum]|nr:hypothetical protein DFJ74DRAFT_707400 [Hyaloraphidium curvatum]